MAGRRDADIERVAELQALSNRKSAEHAALYRGHRQHFTAAIAALAPAASTAPFRLALVGAGNCHDVDLAELTKPFGDVHLFDIDAAALERAHRRQAADVKKRLHRHAPMDASGVAAHLGRWRKNAPTPGQLEALLPAAVGEATRGVEGSFDLVVSCCLATQLSAEVAHVLGDDHPAADMIRRHAITAHLRILTALARSGGRVLFVSDLVSSETYPIEEMAAERDLAAIVAEVIDTGNYFKGVDPPLLGLILRRDPVLAARAGARIPVRPWLWQQMPERTYIVYGFSFPVR